MQLRKSEALGVFDDHCCGVGYVDSDFDYSCRYKNLSLAAYETLHLVVLFRCFLSAVDKCHFIFAERFANVFISLLEAFERKFFVLFDKRVDDIYLVPLPQLRIHALIYFQSLLFITQQGFHRFAARRQFVDYRHVEIAVDCHGQCARNRSGRHHKHVRRNRTFFP